MRARPPTSRPRRVLLGWPALLAAAGTVLLGPATSRAHLVADPGGLRQLAARCDLALVARFEPGPRRWRAPDGSASVEYFTVRVEETLGGEPPGRRLDFVPHAEGFPSFEAGDRAVIFLEKDAGHSGPASGTARFPLYSVQSAGQEWRLGAQDDDLVSVVRGYLALRSASGSEGLDRFRAILLQELRSADPRLREDAVRELIRLGRSRVLFGTPEALAPFASLLEPRGLPVAESVVLASILEAQADLDVTPHLRALAGQTLSSRERSALIRAAGRSRDRWLSGWLATQLGDPDPTVRSDAATALGQPWHAGQVPALARAARDPDERVARAALRALTRVGTEPATAALRELASDGSAPLRRVAVAELRRTAAERALPPP